MIVARICDYARERSPEKITDILWLRAVAAQLGLEYSAEIIVLPVVRVERIESPADCAQ